MEVESVIGEYCEKEVSPRAYVSSLSNIIQFKRSNIWILINEPDDNKFQQYFDWVIQYSVENSNHQ